MLRTLLRKDRLLPMDRFTLGRLLALQTCWPHDPELTGHAVRHGFAPPAPPRPGEVPLLSVNLHGATMWLLSHRGSEKSTTHLVGTAREALELAERLAIRDAPLLLSLAGLDEVADWWPAFVVRDGTDFDRVLEGGSFGLSMVLAVTSLLLGLPVPADAVASAALQPDGKLAPVDGLREKVSLVASWGLGVRRFLVAAPQEAEARAHAEAAKASFEVVAVADVRSALGLVFGDVAEAIARRLASTEALTQAATSLFELALRNDPRILDWGAVERGAELLLRFLPERLAFHGRFALQVARRHQGKPARLPIPTDEELGAFHIDVEHAYYAHVLQSLSDVAAKDCDSLLARIRARLPVPMRSSVVQLELHGAVGRALRTLRRYDEASQQLETTVAAWRAAGHFGRASYALSAWLHVLGIRRDRAGLDRALQFAEQYRRLSERDELALAYVAFDCGRALLLVGDASAALAWLSDGAADWEMVHDHLRRSRLRWLAGVYRALGDSSRCAAARALLEREPAAIERHLADLDEALATGADLEPILERCAAIERDLVCAFLDPALPLRDRAERLAREYPY